MPRVIFRHVTDIIKVILGDALKIFLGGCRENGSCFATSSMESIDADQMPHIMVDFRLRKSRWRINGEAVHFRLEYACFPASCALRAYVHRASTVLP